MKSILLLSLVTVLGIMPVCAQTTTPPATDTSGESAFLEKLDGMKAAQRRKFLNNHPEARERYQAIMIRKYEGLPADQKPQFLETHPNVAKRIANASAAGSPTIDPGHPRVNEVNGRENEQQKRIANGVADGVLTQQQAAQLEKGEQKIQSREATDMALHNGHLTAGEQRSLNHEENRVSGRILEDKTQSFENMSAAQKAQFAQAHPELAQRFTNASQAGSTTTDPGHPRVNEVNARENNQEQRIVNGEKSGALTPQEANNLQKGEQNIKNREALDMANHNGHLTEGEKRGLNREENRESERIRKEKKTGKK